MLDLNCARGFSNLRVPGFRASLGGQKYHASPHKANKKRDAMGENKKGWYSEKKQEEVKGA